VQIETGGTAVLQARQILAAGAGSWHSLLTALGSAQNAGRNQVSWTAIAGSVASGVMVVVIIAAARGVWHHMRVPSALTRRVRRRSYLGAVRAESSGRSVQRLDVYAPRLLPARENRSITGIQSAWKEINQRGKVRVLTLDHEECLQAGAELLDKGIEVRVLPNERDLGSDVLTFHLFEKLTLDDAVAIVNRHRSDGDRPVRIPGVASVEAYRGRFRGEWDKARPLESVIAERVLRHSYTCQGRVAVWKSIEEAKTAGLHLGPCSHEKILPHLAFQDSCAVVFILGLPGAGKSYVRSKLANRLESMRIECQQMTDYPYAYLDLMKIVLKLDQQSSSGFKAHERGAFTVPAEKSLLPALRTLHSDVRDALQTREVTLVEFARSDLVAALQEFDDIRSRAQILYVNAPADLRHTRLTQRATPPEIRVDGQAITLHLSDNHLLPSSAERALYTADNLELIKQSAHWRSRTTEIDNEKTGSNHIDAKIDEFIDRVIIPYRGEHNKTSQPQIPAPTLR
jgi:hypothetical protein